MLAHPMRLPLVYVFDSPIYTFETILAEAGIVLTDQKEEEEKEKIIPKSNRSQSKERDTSKRNEDFKSFTTTNC